MFENKKSTINKSSPALSAIPNLKPLIIVSDEKINEFPTPVNEMKFSFSAMPRTVRPAQQAAGSSKREEV
jgi:hypothetical protein